MLTELLAHAIFSPDKLPAPLGTHNVRFSTIKAYDRQGERGLPPAGVVAYTVGMPDSSPASRKLKELRLRAGLSIREVAHALGKKNGSSYQHYEDRFHRPYLPRELVEQLMPIFDSRGITSSELLALAGDINARAAAGERDRGMLRIDELDVRASAGAGLMSSNERVVAEWQVPTGIVRGYSTAPAAELRIITVIGDSMEPALLPGQRVLVDTGDRAPSPPGIFVVWDGLGQVVKRVQVLPHSDPPRVRITSDNGKYDAYERTLDEAYIQGRVIGQWRWL
jgi:hypothetical protein